MIKLYIRYDENSTSIISTDVTRIIGLDDEIQSLLKNIKELEKKSFLRYGARLEARKIAACDDLETSEICRIDNEFEKLNTLSRLIFNSAPNICSYILFTDYSAHITIIPASQIIKGKYNKDYIVVKKEANTDLESLWLLNKLFITRTTLWL